MQRYCSNILPSTRKFACSTGGAYTTYYTHDHYKSSARMVSPIVLEQAWWHETAYFPVYRYSCFCKTHTQAMVLIILRKNNTQEREPPLQTGDQKEFSSHPVRSAADVQNSNVWLFEYGAHENLTLSGFFFVYKNGRALCGKPSAKLTICCLKCACSVFIRSLKMTESIAWYSSILYSEENCW